MKGYNLPSENRLTTKSRGLYLRTFCILYHVCGQYQHRSSSVESEKLMQRAISVIFADKKEFRQLLTVTISQDKHMCINDALQYAEC